MSLARQNFPQVVETAFNEHINAELAASYAYLAIAAHFDRDDVALYGFRNYFRKQSEEEREHAQQFIDYVNKRGGRVTFATIPAPSTSPESPAGAFEFALKLERTINEKLLKLHDIANRNNDPLSADFIEEFLEEQVEAIKKLADYVSQLKRVGEGVGLYMFDKNLS